MRDADVSGFITLNGVHWELDVSDLELFYRLLGGFPSRPEEPPPPK